MLGFDSIIAAEGNAFKDTVEKLVRISNIFLKVSFLLNLFFVIWSLLLNDVISMHYLVESFNDFFFVILIP